MSRLLAALLVSAGFAFACSGDDVPDPPLDTPQSPARLPVATLHGVPKMPGAQLVSTSGSEDAMEVVAYSTAGLDSVTGWYRREFLELGWRILGDATRNDGSVTLHARDEHGRPVWVMLRSSTAPAGTMITTIGAVTASP